MDIPQGSEVESPESAKDQWFEYWSTGIYEHRAPMGVWSQSLIVVLSEEVLSFFVAYIEFLRGLYMIVVFLNCCASGPEYM